MRYSLILRNRRKWRHNFLTLGDNSLEIHRVVLILGNDTTTKIRGDNYPDTGGMGRNKENHYDFKTNTSTPTCCYASFVFKGVVMAKNKDTKYIPKCRIVPGTQERATELNNGGALLFHLIRQFYERTSLTITTNLKFSEWVQVFW